MKARTDDQIRAAIENGTARVPFSGCQIWMGSCMANGYGQIGYRGKNDYAHRVSWLLSKGEIPNNVHVLHRCDVRCCVNPDHLFLGSPADNVRDMIEKGRQKFLFLKGAQPHNKGLPSKIRGALHPMAKLTESDVSEIRRRHEQGETQTQLSNEFKVNQPHISRIIRNANWR